MSQVKRSAPTTVLLYSAIVDREFNGRFGVKRFENVFKAETFALIQRYIKENQNAFTRSRVGTSEVVSAQRKSESIGIDETTRLPSLIRREIAERVFGEPALADAICPERDRILQIQRYGPGGFFNVHHDEIDYDANRPFPVVMAAYGKRVLTVFVYLNDGFDGGQTEFPLANDAVVPKANMAAAWPNYTRDGRADELAIHQAKPIAKRGNVEYKYGMNVWFCLTEGVLETAEAPRRPTTLLTPRRTGVV